MATEEPQTSSVVRVPAEPEIAGVQLIGQEALAELVVRVALAELAVRVDRVALAELGIVQAAERAIAPAVGRELGIDPVVARERAIVQVEELVLAIVPAVAEPALLIDRAEVLALEIVPAEVQALLIVPVEAAPEHDLGAGVLRTKSETAAPRRGLAAVLAVEDSAAVAETTRDPAATEVVAAWVAAV
jgi:hypothetical protein